MKVGVIFEIKPSEGLSSLSFGASMELAKTVFGEPEEVEVLDDIEDALSTVWHYWNSGFSLFFDDLGTKQFCCVEIDNPDALLFGKRIFELNEQEIISLFKQNKYSQFETEVHEWGEKRLSFDDANIDFYFEKNQLTSINYGKPILSSQILILPN